MKKFLFNVQSSLLATAVIAEWLCFGTAAHAAGPAVPSPDDPISLSITPRYMYRPPSIVGTPPTPEPSEPQAASGAGADDWTRQTPALEKPDNWACRTSNNLSRSSIGRNPDGKSISDIQGLLPKC